MPAPGTLSEPGCRWVQGTQPHATQLYQHVPETRWPIVYSPRYNITFMGLEKLHPFDAGKWGKVISFLKGDTDFPSPVVTRVSFQRKAGSRAMQGDTTVGPWDEPGQPLPVSSPSPLGNQSITGCFEQCPAPLPALSLSFFCRMKPGLSEEKLLSDAMLVEAREASEEDLLVVHTRRYLNELKWSFAVATITEIPPVIFLPNFLVQRKVLRPLRTQTGGTIMFLFDRVEGIARATIIDLDAHQGNGHERDFMGDKRVYIMDVYNRHIYPGDLFAKQAIRRKVELEWGTEDDEYLSKVERNVERALREHLPDVVVYNAGTDVLEGDRLGGLSISPGGILKRDELVFRVVRAHQIPILMVTSGGYQKRTARIIADSILNLHDLGLIGPDSPSVSAQSSDLPPLPPAGP
ncbi:histone deacetylase 11 isoform X3 [Heterocephalus glaber]|uniref:Histone deacetylase 11 isoform X3 n=1 Tax=Heterocephalus glaber TaxID=10181 RepID=A0AAX6RHC3_HETGA|nr:histone deacetylase 11 isoform X3 [Heterocephalus glaber]